MITDKLRSYGAARAKMSLRVEHRQHKGLKQSSGELPPTDAATRADHEALQINQTGATVSVGSRSSRQPLPRPLSRNRHRRLPPRFARASVCGLARDLQDGRLLRRTSNRSRWRVNRPLKLTVPAQGVGDEQYRSTICHKESEFDRPQPLQTEGRLSCRCSCRLTTCASTGASRPRAATLTASATVKPSGIFVTRTRSPDTTRRVLTVLQ